jgi:hypothetical protein
VLEDHTQRLTRVEDRVEHIDARTQRIEDRTERLEAGVLTILSLLGGEGSGSTPG